MGRRVFLRKSTQFRTNSFSHGLLIFAPAFKLNRNSQNHHIAVAPQLSCKRTINTSEKISPKCELALDRISQTCTSAGIAPLTKSESYSVSRIIGSSNANEYAWAAGPAPMATSVVKVSDGVETRAKNFPRDPQFRF